MWPSARTLGVVLRKGSRHLGGVPSLGWILLYVGLIPTFAALYSSMPSGFYHSTVAHEPAIAADERLVCSDLMRSLPQGFVARHGWPPQAVTDGYQVDFISVFVRWCAVDRDGIHFLVEPQAQRVGSNVVETFPEVEFVAAPVADWGPTLRRSGEDLYRFGVKSLASSPYPIDLRVLFREDKGTEKAADAVLLLRSEARNRYVGIQNALYGIPRGAGGGFLRMLYFSAVTITTLGYGDVVPLTNSARLLVALQAVGGVLVAGLFLNAVAREATQDVV